MIDIIKIIVIYHYLLIFNGLRQLYTLNICQFICIIPFIIIKPKVFHTLWIKKV